MKYRLIAGIIVVMGATALSVGAVRTPGALPSSVEVTITAPQSNTVAIPVVAAAGSQFTIKLESNRTTGYRWSLAGKPNARVVKLIGSVYNEPESGRVGQGGSEMWSFKAAGKGKVRITLNYARSWEKGVAPVRMQTFDVAIQ